MVRKIVSGIMSILLVLSMLSLLSYILPVRAQGTIHIRADGSIDPPTAPISTVDNITYTFTGDINDSIYVERDNIVLDGAGFTVQGIGTGIGIDLSNGNNVTIKNMNIRNFYYGIILYPLLYPSSGNSISGNNITNNGVGIQLESSVNYSANYNSISGNNITNNNDGIALWSSGNSVSGNNVTNNNFGICLGFCSNNSVSGNTITANNEFGIVLDSSSSNSIFHNNFVNNNIQVIFSSDSVNIWDDGYPSGGNYWSDYTGVDVKKGPNQDEPGSDDLGDMPYILDENNRDHYPLMNPYGSPPPLNYSLTITATADGTTNPAPGTYTYSRGQVVPVQAIPNTGYILDHWERDGTNVGSTNPIGVLMDENHTLYAVFVEMNYTLQITTTVGGTTNPTADTYTYPAGLTIQVTAIPDANYILDHWELDGVNIGATNPISITMDTDHTLYAVFVYVGIRDIAVTNVASSKTVVGQGYSLNVNVTAANQGHNAETFNVTAYYGNGTFTPEQWNVFWSMGDCNRDGYINLADVNIAAANFGWTGTPGGNPADINSDGKVNMVDIGSCAKHVGYEIWKYFLPVIDTQTIVDLAGGDSAAVMFAWNTTGVAYGNYTVTAVADPVANETNTADNNVTCIAPVHIGVPGDISGPTQGAFDQTVNMRDIQYLILLFNTNPGSPNWKPNADINNDATVNMRDVQIAILNFNKHE